MAPGRRTGFNGAVSTSYGYDTAGRLNALTNNLPASTYNNQWSFTFTPAGQIASTTRTNDLFAWSGHYNVNRNYTANGLNQYTAAGPAAFCYDANGNLTADGASVYLYDVENRLIEKRAQGAGNTNCAALSYAGTLQAGLRYDPNGRLYEVTGASGVTRMLYDGDALTAEYDAGGTLLRRYVHGADGAADDPVAWYEGSAFTPATERHLRPDWQGSVVLVTDGTGATVLGVNRYDEYGIPQSSNTGRFQYTGQAWLAELGMYYYKARIYSPTLGRFLQTDPIGYKDQVNMYVYVGGDPVNGVDPTGMSCTVYGQLGTRFDTVSCRVDDPGDMDPKQVKKVNAAYTAVVKKLLQNPNRSMTVKVGGKEFKTKQGVVANGLIRSYVEYDPRASQYGASATTRGGEMDPELLPGARRNPAGPSFMRGNLGLPYRIGLSKDFFDGSLTQKQMGSTIVHEGIHTAPGEGTFRSLNYGRWLTDHDRQYDEAAEDALSQ